MKKQRKVAIIGAGITGLTTAFYLRKNGIDVTLYEKSEHIGGVIKTIKEDGFLYETGPNSGTISQPEVAELFDDLKNDCRLETANPAAANRLIWKNGKWHSLPSGIGKGITTPLFSPKDKLRILGEPFRKKGTNPNESLADLVKRRMGKSFLDYAIDPFILGIYAGDPSYIVPKYALPKLYQLEQNYGSFIGGAIKKKKEPKSEADKKATREIFSVEGGLEELVKALIKHIGKENIITQCGALEINPLKDTYRLTGIGFDEIYDNVISTVSANELPLLFPFINKNSLKPVTKLLYAKVTEVSIGFKQWNGISLNAFGGLIPFKENMDILGVLFMSTLFKNRAPGNGALLTTFVGGMRKPHLADLSEKEIFPVIEKEISRTMGLKTFNPDLFRTRQYRRAIAQYGADSGERLNAISAIEEKYPGIQLAGSIRDGIGMADRIKQGKKIAENIINAKA